MVKETETDVLRTIRYFLFFNYPPNLAEIHTFLRKKTSKNDVASILEKMKQKKLLTAIKNDFRYTLGEYSSTVQNWEYRKRISEQKIKKIQPFIGILSKFPQIQLVSLSGTVAMKNADEKDDVDIFIISEKNRLWTARMIALIAAQFFGIRRKAGDRYAEDKVCLNLFFDRSDLKVPVHKQTEYVAHEVLQTKPLINKNNSYERFLSENDWVYQIFPNAGSKNKKLLPYRHIDKLSLVPGNILEFFLKKLQLTMIKLHQTNEIVTHTQLWFFPEDFEKKIKYNT